MLYHVVKCYEQIFEVKLRLHPHLSDPRSAIGTNGKDQKILQVSPLHMQVGCTSLASNET
jgi:hypothetical protein